MLETIANSKIRPVASDGVVVYLLSAVLHRLARVARMCADCGGGWGLGGGIGIQGSPRTGGFLGVLTLGRGNAFGAGP